MQANNDLRKFFLDKWALETNITFTCNLCGEAILQCIKLQHLKICVAKCCKAFDSEVEETWGALHAAPIFDKPLIQAAQVQQSPNKKRKREETQAIDSDSDDDASQSIEVIGQKSQANIASPSGSQSTSLCYFVALCGKKKKNGKNRESNSQYNILVNVCGTVFKLCKITHLKSTKESETCASFMTKALTPGNNSGNNKCEFCEKLCGSFIRVYSKVVRKVDVGLFFCNPECFIEWGKLEKDGIWKNKVQEWKKTA